MTMPEYRFYTLKSGNQMVAPPDVIDCASDQDAIDEAKKFLDGFDVEIWQGARIVTRLRPSDGK
jgi:hypothetical protein